MCQGWHDDLYLSIDAFKAPGIHLLLWLLGSMAGLLSAAMLGDLVDTVGARWLTCVCSVRPAAG